MYSGLLAILQPKLSSLLTFLPQKICCGLSQAIFIHLRQPPFLQSELPVWVAFCFSQISNFASTCKIHGEY